MKRIYYKRIKDDLNYIGLKLYLINDLSNSKDVQFIIYRRFDDKPFGCTNSKDLAIYTLIECLKLYPFNDFYVKEL